MPSTPVDDHTEEFEQLAGLMALEVLEGEERLRFEQHAATCERCRVIVRLDREALARAVPEMEPSPGFKERLLDRARQDLAAGTSAAETEPRREPTPLRPPPNVIPLWRRPRLVSVLAAVLVLALVSAGAFTYQNQVVGTYTLQGSLPGSATVTVHRNGNAELTLTGVAVPPPGLLYEAWIIPEGGKPIPAGITPNGDAQLALNGVSNGTTIALTEERGQEPAPTSQPVMATVIKL